jgi:hypothetical protein
VNRDLEALLAVQVEDGAIRALDERIAALAPRLRHLDEDRRRVAEACERAVQAVEKERRFRASLETRVAEHRGQLERHLQRMNDVRKMREATAAEVQVTMARQVVEEEERELAAVTRRIADQEAALAARQAELAELDAAQAETREVVARERGVLENERAELAGRRDEKARAVPRQLLAHYDRIRHRREDDALFALRGSSCGSCDTAIPLQRRSGMAAGARIEVCEECGVLLYAVP